MLTIRIVSLTAVMAGIDGKAPGHTITFSELSHEMCGVFTVNPFGRGKKDKLRLTKFTSQIYTGMEDLTELYPHLSHPYIHTQSYCNVLDTGGGDYFPHKLRVRLRVRCA